MFCTHSQLFDFCLCCLRLLSQTYLHSFIIVTLSLLYLYSCHSVITAELFHLSRFFVAT